MSISIQIKEKRQALGMTQQEVADKSGVGVRTIKQLEKGEGNPSLHTLNRILEVLKMEVVIKNNKGNDSNSFTVAGHTFVINHPQEIDINSLFPSLQPFASTEKEYDNRLFSLTFTPDIPVYEHSTLLTHFEWDDAECFIYTSTEGYAILIHPKNENISHRMLVNKEFTIAFIEIKKETPITRLAAGNFLMMLYAFASAPHNTLMFHASVVCNKDKGYLFLGKSGTGKSTHSRLWLEHIAGSELLNDDNPIVRIYSNGEAWVYGSPWSGKNPCYRNEAVPIGAFVRIKQAPGNRIKQQQTVKAFASLLPSCSCLQQEKYLFDAVCDTVSLLATTTPVYELECLPDFHAAQICYSFITQG